MADRPRPGHVTLTPVFHMPTLNERKTAFQVFRGKGTDYLVHLTDGATGQMVMGFLDRRELIELRDALNKELAS